MNIPDLAEILEEKGRVSTTGPTTNLYVLTDKGTAEDILSLVGTGKVIPAAKQYRYNLSRVPDVYYVLKAAMPYFETDALEYEFSVVEERYEELTHGRLQPRTPLAPNFERPPIDEETAKEVRKVFRIKGLDKSMSHGKVYKPTTKKRAEFLRGVFGGTIHPHKKPKPGNDRPLHTWRLYKKDEIERLKEVLGVG